MVYRVIDNEGVFFDVESQSLDSVEIANQAMEKQERETFGRLIAPDAWRMSKAKQMLKDGELFVMLAGGAG